jgi:hypothetical protein
MGSIGAIALRLHGFHRFLPRLWELFYCAPNSNRPGNHPLEGSSRAVSLELAALLAPADAGSPCFHQSAAGGRKIGITPIFASLYRSYSTGNDGPPDTTPHVDL